MSREVAKYQNSTGHRVDQIFGSGEMVERTRAFDWASTTVGAIEDWPEPLLVLVNTLLNCPHPMFLWWGDDLIQFYNDAYRKSIGDDKHPRALGQRAEECWPEIWPIIYPQIEQVMTTGVPTWNEDQLVPIYRNGVLEDVYWTYSYSAVRDSCGVICGTLVTCSETTRRQLTEQSLREQLHALGELFEQAPAFFCLLRGPQHVFERINPLYQQLLGPRDLIGKPVAEAVPEAEQQGFIQLLDDVYRTGEPYIGRNLPIQLARRGSQELEERVLDFVYQPMRNAEGQVTGIIALGIDTTEARLAEHALRQSEKLAVVGRLASSIAHEINNPLESVTNLIYLARQSAVDPEAKQYLASAEIELRRVAAITTQTLRFHRQTTRPRPANASDLVESTLAVFHGRLAYSHIHSLRRERAAHPVLCFEGEIRQVLSNLVGNAIDALQPAGGYLLVRTREGRDWRTGKRGVVITVADTGSGMTPDTQARILEPFFSTKGISGTGLGLWISSEIIGRHEGALRVRSRTGSHSGTVFALFLPFEAAVRENTP